MAWNGTTPNAPNWAGVDNTSGGGDSVGDLYILPDPPSIAENPSIGLEGRNEVPLPTKYLDMEVANLTATNIDAEDITTTNLTADDITTGNLTATNITATTINGNPNFDASNWSLYPAISNVLGTLGAFSLPLYSISNFLNITAANNITATAGNLTAGIQVDAPVANFTFVNVAEDINVSSTNETADVNIYGANLLPGDNALFVEGGTTLTGGGIIHGTTIGALRDPVGGVIDLVRIDVLPAGMLLTSATFITITSVGATAVSGAGTLALAGGDYITYNSDEHRFINTTSGNDFTDILVGNVHPAYNGSANLRINGGGSGRGVELADVKSLALWTELPIATWVNSTAYNIGQKVKFGNVYYNCVVDNAYTQPNIPIPNWVSASNYIAGTIVFSSPYAFRCSASISGSTTPPNPTSDPNWFNLGLLTNDITAIWSVYSPYASYISGDELSSVNVGNVGADTIAVDLLVGKTDPYTINTTASILADAGVRVINNFNSIQLKGQPSFNATFGFLSSTADVSSIAQDNSTGQMVITTSDGLTINTATSTDFSAGDVVNLKNLTLTTALNPTWNDVVVYPLNTIVEWDGYNWRSEIADNTRNEPSTTLQNWQAGGFYPLGSVRYYAPNNKAYICILTIFGSSTTPDVDTTHFAEFQTGSNGEDVWYQMNAVVESNIVGDRLSSIEIGTQDFVCEAGTYLSVGQDISQVGTIDGTIASGGSVTVAGNDNATLGAITGTATIVGDSVYILTYPTTGGNILVEANDELALGAINDASLGSTTGNVNITTIAGDIVLNSADALTLGGANNVVLGSTAGDVTLGSTAGNVVITSTAGDITLTSEEATSISSANSSLTLSSAEATNITSTANAVNLTGFAGVNINSPDAISLTSSASDVNITAGTGDKVIVNSTLDLTNKNVINANTITGQGALTLATTGATNLNLSPDTGGLIVANKGLNLSNNNVTNANTITGQTALSLTAANGGVNIAATGTGNRINLNSDTTLGNRTLFNFTGTNVGGIYGLTTQPLALVGQQTTPQIHLRGATQMWATASVQAPGNSISGVTTLNGRNLFSYGNFYNTATQTLGAINTATRIQMNTSANNNNITLDTTTNIGRITFTNAGVYQVSWSAYLLHGSGGTAKSVIWIRLNGTDVAGSGKTENNDSQLNETNLASTSLVSVTANQYIEFYWASDHTSVPLTDVAASAPYPATPSFACSIQIVG
jgi:hypothetical protein